MFRKSERAGKTIVTEHAYVIRFSHRSPLLSNCFLGSWFNFWFLIGTKLRALAMRAYFVMTLGVKTTIA